MSQSGYDAVARLLRDPRCTLEEFRFTPKRITGANWATSFANSLIGNRTLKRLCIYGGGVTGTDLGAFSHILCDTASIDATYYSNHTLHSIERDLYDDNTPITIKLRKYLELNRNDDKLAVAQQKVFIQHIVHDFRMQSFEGMEPNLLVRVLTFIDNGIGGLVLFTLIKSLATVLAKMRSMMKVTIVMLEMTASLML